MLPWEHPCRYKRQDCLRPEEGHCKYSGLDDLLSMCIGGYGLGVVSSVEIERKQFQLLSVRAIEDGRKHFRI